MLQSKDSPTNVYAIGAKLLLKLPQKCLKSKLQIDPIKYKPHVFGNMQALSDETTNLLKRTLVEFYKWKPESTCNFT